MTANQAIIKVKINEIFLFNRIEQDRGKYSKRVYLCMNQNVQREVQEQIQNFCSNEFKINNKIMRMMLVKAITQEEQIMNQATNTQILVRLKVIEIEEKSARSYSQVV